MIEIWKDISGYEGLYQISNLGRVKSLPKTRGRYNGYLVDEIIMKPKLSKYGYLLVGLRNKTKSRKFFSIHRLLGLHFIPNPENKPTIDHIDRNKLNNSLDNLRWATEKEQSNNRNDRIITEELRNSYRKSGFNKRTEIINNIDYDELYNFYISKNNSLKDTAMYFNIPYSTLTKVLKRYNIKKYNKK